MVLKIIEYLGIVFGVIILGLLYGGIARKVIARIHRRYGSPFYQNILDVLKLFAKSNEASHGVMFNLGPVIAFTGVLVSLFFIPFGSFRPLFSFEGDIFVVFYLLVVAPLGMALGAGEGANPNATIGIARGLTLMLGYELVFFLSVLAPMIHYRTASIATLVTVQSAFPHWNVFPFFISAFAGLIALHGMMGEKPFDQVIAPHEIASGPMVEYSGKFLGLLQLYHAVGIIVETGLVVDIFFGGGNWLTFILKTFFLFITLVIINAVMPRFRIGQAVKFYWKYPLVISLIGLLIVAIWR